MSNVSILIAAIILCVTVECQCSEEPEIKPLNTVNPITKSSRLLFVPAPSYSHLNVLKIIATDLCQSSEYHHQCTFAVFDEQLDSFRSATNIFKVITFGKIPLPPKVDGSKIKTTLQFHSHITLPFFSNLYKPMHHALMNHLKTNTYDLLIINMFAFAAQDIAYDLKIPYVILAYTTVEGNLILPSWIPRGYDFMTPTDLTMSIIRRFYNKFIVPIQMLYYLWPHMQRLDRIRIECNRSTHGSFSTPIIQRWNGHPVLLPYSRAFDFKRPLSMNYHYVGFVTGESQADASKSEDDKSVQFWLNKNSEDKEEKEVIMYVGLGESYKKSLK
ncbi:hypothetical protein I4U23_000020 [Adineta vaga]|nr:hypothetical protein I4U23_000020 [Adineta vaga]